MNRSVCRASLALLSSCLSACGHLSGLDGSSHYACKAPPGVSCQSVSAVYASHSPPQAATDGPARSALPAMTQQPSLLVAPLRSAPRILRLWFKPWVDSDNDLYDQGYIYVQIDNGHWLLEGAQNRIRAAYAPRLRPPRASAASAPSPRPPAPVYPAPSGQQPAEPAVQSAGEAP